MEKIEKEEKLDEPQAVEASIPVEDVVEELEPIEQPVIKKTPKKVQNTPSTEPPAIEKEKSLDDEWIGGATTPKLEEEKDSISQESKAFIGSDLEEDDEDEAPAYQQKYCCTTRSFK